MRDLQSVVDAMGEAMQNERKKYHLTLGELIEALEEADDSLIVEFASCQPPGKLHSYRGYYEDLAFSTGSKPVTVSDVLESAREANGETFTGYKGGEYEMDEDTPLWWSEFGSSNGPPLIDIEVEDDRVLLVEGDA